MGLNKKKEIARNQGYRHQFHRQTAFLKMQKSKAPIKWERNLKQRLKKSEKLKGTQLV